MYKPFELHRVKSFTNQGIYFFKVKGRNGKTIATSEVYMSRRNAIKGMIAVFQVSDVRSSWKIKDFLSCYVKDFALKKKQ